VGRERERGFGLRVAGLGQGARARQPRGEGRKAGDLTRPPLTQGLRRGRSTCAGVHTAPPTPDLPFPAHCTTRERRRRERLPGGRGQERG